MSWDCFALVPMISVGQVGGSIMKTIFIFAMMLSPLFASALTDITHDVLVRGDMGKVFESAEKTLLSQGYELVTIKTVFDSVSRHGRPVPMALVTYCSQGACDKVTDVEVRVRVSLIEAPPPPPGAGGGGFENAYGEPLAIQIGSPDLFK